MCLPTPCPAFLLQSTFFSLMGLVLKPQVCPTWVQIYRPRAVGPVPEPQVMPRQVGAASVAWWSAVGLEEDWEHSVLIQIHFGKT